MNRADVLIIGAGPAGMSAALSLARQQHRTILFGDGTYRNDRTDYMHLIPGFDHVKPSEFRRTARSNILSNYSHVSFEDVKLVKAHKDLATGLFTVSDATGRSWSGKKLILANGIEDLPLPIEGYAECWGKAM